MRNRVTGWWEALQAYRHPRVLAMLFLGFSAGLPFPLVFATLTALLSDAGIDKRTIGFFAWIGLTYSFKFAWAPVVDRLPLPLLGRWLGQRRSWMLLAQVGALCGILAMAGLNPADDLRLFAWMALAVAFSSATQDITIDAWRIEAVEERRQGAMAAAYNFGYRVAVLVGTAGALFLADFYDWSIAYQVMALCMGVGIVTVLLISEPGHARDRETTIMEERLVTGLIGGQQPQTTFQRLEAWFASAVVAPFVDFFRRNGTFAFVLLALILTFNISDRVLGIMANPFYLDLGFTKSEIAGIAKVFGLAMTLGGAALGGVLVARYGNLPTMLLAAVLLALTNLMFAALALVGPDIRFLMLTISGDNLSMGLAGVAFIAYLSSLTNQAYTATQYALFSSMMSIVGKFISGWSGVVVEAVGYPLFFVYAACTGIPAIILVLLVMRHLRREKGEAPSATGQPSAGVSHAAEDTGRGG